MPINPFARSLPSLWPGGVLDAITLGTEPLVFDASVQEQHGEQYGVATSPIEGGALVTDHVQRQPVVLTVDVVLTDNPDGGFEDFTSARRDRYKDLYGQILAVARTREPFDFVTSLRFYPSMVFTSIGAPRTKDTGSSLICSLVMREIEIATVDQAAVLADAALAIALGKQNLGNISPDVTAALDDLQAPVLAA